MGRGFRDRDFVETPAGIFCVIGSTHPPDRVIAYLKYVPTREPQIWSRGGIYYERKMKYYSAEAYLDVMQYLRSAYPHYVVYDDLLGLELIEVPKSEITVHYRPEERAREILTRPGDSLEQIAHSLLQDVLAESGLPDSLIGITGSLLLKIHNVERSDIDLIVYSRRSIPQVLEAVEKLRRSGKLRVPDWLIEETVQQLRKAHPHLDVVTLRRVVIRRTHRMVYQGRVVSLLFAQTEDEVREPYGQYRYRAVRPVKLRARVVNAEDSLFLPAVYDVEVLSLEPQDTPRDIRYVISYEGLYSGIAREGEEIIVEGMLEKVENLRTGEVYYRVVVGSAALRGRDYILPVDLMK